MVLCLEEDQLEVGCGVLRTSGQGTATSGGAGARAVLEVRSHDVPFLIEDGQIVGRLVYERMCDVPDLLYGAGLSSSYQGQGLSLGKQFKRPTA